MPTIIEATKFHVTIETLANETIDTELYLPETGQVKLLPSYYSGAGSLEVSGDGDTWIALAQNPNSGVLLDNTINYPRYIRTTGDAKIFFNTNNK